MKQTLKRTSQRDPSAKTSAKVETRNPACRAESRRGGRKREPETSNTRRNSKNLSPAISAPPKTTDDGGKTPCVQSLETAIAARRKSQTELLDLRKLLAEKSARQDTLEKTGNVDDLAVITEIASLQVFTYLLPRRIAAHEEADAQAEQTLIEAVNQFIHQHLGPRVRRLAARTRALVQAELTPHYRDPSALSLAIAQSNKVRTIESLALPVSLQPPRGALEHAETVLKAWTAADKFEKTLPM